MLSSSPRAVNGVDDRTPVALRRFSKVVAVCTLFLVFAGAMVTSTGSGLAVPDWPLSYGMLMPPMIGGIFYEHGHRMIAATVGFLTLIQAFWLQFREPKRFLRRLGWAALGAVIVQGMLGGLTVLLLLPPAVSVAHAGLAEIFFCINVSIAFFASRWYHELRNHEKGKSATGMTSTLVALVYTQILIGAVMRHLGAGLAIPDFPLSFGRLVPPFDSAPILINFAHRVGGVTVLAFMLFVALRLRRFEAGHPLRAVSAFLTIVVPAQVLLGAYTVWSAKQPHVTSLHVMNGALTLALSVILWLTSRSVAWTAQPQPAETLVGSEVTA
jgi:cytochrome c oxidase assembly protein subunit 15